MHHFPVAIPEAKAFATEQQILKILAAHFISDRNWSFDEQHRVWIYMPAGMEQIKSRFTDLSSAALMHVVRSMKAAGVVYLSKPSYDARSGSVLLTKSYLPVYPFEKGGVELVDIRDARGNFRPVYRSQGEALILSDVWDLDNSDLDNSDLGGGQ
jgi:hypothetical protein